MEMLSEHTLEAAEATADRAARILLQLRGVRAHHRLDVQPACEVAGEIEAGTALAGAISSLNLLITSLVWRRTQRIHAPGSGISGHRHEQESGSGAIYLRQMRTACCR